jgi:hypothetical protein
VLHVLHLAAELSNVLCGEMQATSVCGPKLGGAVCCMCCVWDVLHVLHLTSKKQKGGGFTYSARILLYCISC